MKPKLYLINGPLGAGKTTLLKEMMQTPEFSSARIIENEFASTSIDTNQLHDHQAEVKTIAGVCICCSTGNELIDALSDLSASQEPVIIEATGVANSLQLLEKLVVGDVLSRYELAHGIFVLDGAEAAANTSSILKSYGDELLAADTVIISKLDLVDENDYNLLVEVLGAHGVQDIVPMFDGICDLDSFAESSQMLAYYSEHEAELTAHDTDMNYTIIPLDAPLEQAAMDARWRQYFTDFSLSRMKGDFIDNAGVWWHLEATPAQCRITRGDQAVAQMVCIGKDARNMSKQAIYQTEHA